MDTTTTVNRYSTLLAAALFCTLSSTFAALPAAADNFEPLKVTVKYGDLDVSRLQGSVVLYGRIRVAADKVCSPYDGRDLSAKMHRAACVNKAIDDAVNAVNQPALLAVYSAKTGKTLPVHVALRQDP
jgi:UrcA family protein